MKVYLIYASTSGNVEIVVEFCAKRLEYMGFEAVLLRSEKTLIETIASNQKFIFATSTWDHGRLNPFFGKLFEEMQKEDLSGKQAAFVGLGDRRYEPVFFCKGVDDICNVWLNNGGFQVNTTLKIQGEPYEQLNQVVGPWADQLSKTWIKHHD